MTDEELLILDCVMYDPNLLGAEGTTLGDWAANFSMDRYRESIYDGVHGSGGMTEAQMQNLVDAVKNDPLLSAMSIRDVTRRAGGANMATITLGDTIVVAYEGTHGDNEWIDDGRGGLAGVTDTPDQVVALTYFQDMMDKYGAGRPDVITTGHSKGGNMAVYVAVTTGQVGRVVSLDGQGFDAPFMLKYRDQIARLTPGSVVTYASAMDVVNTFLFPIGPRIYIHNPGLPTKDFFYNHVPYILFEETLGPDGTVVLRPVADQNAGVTMIDGLLDYLAKYMSAADFALLADTAMHLRTDAGGQMAAIFGDYQFPSDWGGPGSSIANLGEILQALPAPYRSMLASLLLLLGNFYKGGGMSHQAFAAIQTLLYGLGLSPLGNYGVLFGPILLQVLLTAAPDVPYWPNVRDFSNATREELYRLADLVARIEPWEFARDVYILPGELDFTADEAARLQYYTLTMDKYNMTRWQITQIFLSVALTDAVYATKIDALTEGIRGVGSTLGVLETTLNGGVL